MKTPIYDFVQNYIASGAARFHMPGHKGRGPLGLEAFDITEVFGADVLYSPDGIIEQSENFASGLFGTRHTFYSTEGSSLAIRAMLAIAAEGGRRTVFAARNAHKAFTYAAALLDLSVVWLGGEKFSHICGCTVTPEALSEALGKSDERPCAVYITSPDYLGNIADIKGLSKVCRNFGVPLLVDNAHGAYLRFLPQDLHPITLGADMCCDSAHKTLPVLTGGAYLHVSEGAPEVFAGSARKYLSLFASTSPSYLTLESLDLCNAYLSGDYAERLGAAAARVARIAEKAKGCGFSVLSREPLKLTLDAKSVGYTGEELATLFRGQGSECEFSDPDFIVFMITPENTEEELLRLERTICGLDARARVDRPEFELPAPEMKMSARKAVLSPSEAVSVDAAEGRVCAEPCVSCPPAVPIVHSGEVIKKEHIQVMKYYGYARVFVVKE